MFRTLGDEKCSRITEQKKRERDSHGEHTLSSCDTYHTYIELDQLHATDGETGLWRTLKEWTK